MNKSVSKETFGDDIPAVKVSGGTMPIFGHTVKAGAPIPDRGFSPNVKTGHPSKGQGK